MNNSKVQVAVRVRPLNPREEGLNSECVVQVTENQITLLPPISCKEKARKEPHIFIYDNCFWTEDKYDTGQEDVFKHLGDGALENIWLGYNVCIFAYGQTGSGKTFSMMGTHDQPGIVPKICSALFNKESNDLETIRIEASYFEIYNEEVRDLLRSQNNQTKLRVREDRLLGPYVEELSCHAVQSYEEIKLLLDQGNKQRAIAETKMNEQSSRSHAILALTVTQACHKMSHDHKSGASRELVSKVSLVDLAGSERSYKSGAQGSQLKESCNINKSLLTLGLVINSLAEISGKKRKSQYVNYRDSVLTWLLKNNLGGNSKTIMLATVSPAADNYQETLSTLRYADSAKRIVNQAVVNEDVKSKAIEELQEEIKRLREQLTTTEHVKTEVQKLKSQLEEKENLLSDLKTSWEEKLKRTEVATQEWKKNLEHMGVILKKQNVTFSNDCYLMQRGTSLTIHNINDIIKIGSGFSQDIQISGPDVECEHCVIRKTEEGEVFLIAVNNLKTHVNGCLCKTKTQLWHEDKIQIGINVFELHQPSRPKPEYMRTNVSSEAEVQTYDELNTENGRSPILSESDGWNSNMIENEKSKTKSAFYKATESSAPTIPASDDDLNSSENKQTSDMFTQISNEPNRQPIDMEVNTTKSEYLEIGEGTEDIMVPCSPQYGETSSQTSEILGNSNGLQSIQDLEDRANFPRILEISREKKELQRTLRRDMSHPSPDNEMEEPDIPLCDKIPNDPVVTSQNDTCEENQNVKTQNVPPQQSNSDTCKASPHENVLHPECDSFSEKSQAEPDLNTSSKREPQQNDKDHCDNDREVDKELASDGPLRTHRQDMSPTSPGDEMEEYNIPTCDQIPDDFPDDSGVTSQHNTCEENQNEKSEEVPHQQSNTDNYNTSSHENVLQQECDSSSEESKAKPDLNTSPKIELLQNDKGLCDNDGDGDTDMASGGLQRTRRQDTSHPHPDDKMEEPHIPLCDKIPDDPIVTSQNDTCEENQNGKTQNVPHQQINSDTSKGSPHENVLHLECDSFSEKSQAEPDLNTSSKREPLQNEKGLCDNDGDGDTDMASGGLQKTLRQDTSHPSPHVEIEKPNISPSDKIPDDFQVTSQHKTCEENQHEKTEGVPPQQSNSDTNIASPHENFLHQECEFSSEKPKAEPDLNTSSKIEMQNDKGLCDNDREGDKELASDELQRTCRQDMSHTSLDDKMEESNIPPGDKLPDDTSQHQTCEENQDEKTEEVPHQQSNTDTYNASPHGSVLHQESDDSSEKPKVEPDLNTSSKKDLPQNDKGHCDLDGENDTGMSSDDDFVECSSEFTLNGEHTSCESTIQLQNAAKDSTDHKEPDIDPNTLSSETSTPSVFSEESRKENQNEKENMFKELLEKMKIDTKQTSKLTLQKVLEIGPESLMTDDPSDDDNALWYFVRRLMSLNGDARNINKLFMKSEESGGNKDDSFIFFDESDSQNFIHPLDVVSAAFHCSDHFLQQEMISKMSMCQFAVPLMLPDADGPECTFMLWAMRGIVKKWRPKSLADSKGVMEDSLVNVQMPTISFVRLGNCRLSKSKILNQLLGTTQHQHEHFIHRYMEGGNAARKISDGLVEISWYFPGGKGKFPEPVAFTNLRGNLESNLKQFNFLTEISSVIVILTEGISKDQYELLMKYNSRNTKYLLIISPENTRMKEDTQKRLKLLAPVLNFTQDSISMIPRNTNETTAGSKLYLSLLSLVQNNIKTLSLETISKQASRHGIRIDEDFEECQKAKLAAKEITEEIEDVEKYKKETMKLQAGPLKEMAKLEKEMCQMKGQGNSNGEKYKSELRKKCNSIRQSQWECDIPTGISKFVNAITSTNTSEKFYFLQWLKFHLDVEARKCLYPLQAQYKETCNLPDKQKELAKLDQKISDSSLGIEHFLREVGQFYEAWHYMGKKEKSTTINFESLPKIAADLLLDGFPLELIDGDASRIPLQWVRDVLCELNKKIKRQSRLRVITVLGVQSTGKSTLLNTMFGLQFPVASGRCTRGAFMTLLKVKENFQDDLSCEFILVIDTEGLKAPELDSLDGSYEHDNELATLVIGLSDITLFNMSMENTTEMKDILQIVIHAFLRMKEIGKKPSCQFVHQNVSDVSAPLMNMRGRKKLMDQLDEMTRTVAVMEKKTQFKYFSDIMEYDLEHDNCYIAGLWHGVPPMASVSSAYSENVNELKQNLLKIMKHRRNKTQNINEFFIWVSGLWSAVKHENFIFSFKNSLIAKAYNQLSIKYSEHEWKFKKLMHEWFTKSETLIKNQSDETLEAKANECHKEAEIILTSEEKKILAWLGEYFSKETDGAQLIKYKTDFEISAQSLRKSLETSSINKLNETIQIQKEQLRIDHLYDQQIEKIEKKVSNFIEECRKKKQELSDNELEKELEKIWEDETKDLDVSHRPERDIEGEMLLVLTKDMKEKGSAVNAKLQQTKHFPKPKEQQKQIKISFFQAIWNYTMGRQKKEFQYEDFLQSVLNKCINDLGKQIQKGSDYDDTYCREILKIIDENCKHSDAKNYFSADLEFDLKLTILGHVLVDFQKMHLTFLQNNDPHAKLNSLKPLYFDTFKNVFQKKNESKSLTERVCKDVFKPSLADHINRKLGIEVVDDIANSKGSEKYSSRMFFQFTVLENLLEEDNFENYVEYSSDYKNFVKSWITNYIVKEYKNISTLQERILSDIMGRVRSSLTNPPTLNLRGVSEFLPHLCEKLNSDLVLPQKTMKAIIFENSATIEDFIDYMKNSLTDTEEEIRAELKSLSTEDVLSRLVVKPQDELFKKVFGCGKQCPFCKVPCEAGGTDHKEHFASVHRPKGLGTYRSTRTEVLFHDICTTSVVGNARFKNELTEWKSHPYKDYRDVYPDWKIQPDESIEASDYWKFILKQYNKQFAEEYKAKPANYPEEWNSLTREMAKKSLQKTFNM
ncbi:interferon-induced very large GTPase 1-like [Rana temporaria]|uniref:interferon-induced very large GTPase 1-like n=1 Tax=Rana temporaria TaxID=8407 RepID=UPI001AAD7C05|nr:interferon-induced very large GTPase 1-like [Rana temporaria]